MRRMRSVRRGRPRCDSVPLVLPRRDRAEPELPGPVRCAAAQHLHRLAPAGRGKKVSVLPERPIAILIAALGGEGGGVLADWIIAATTARDYPVQSTSIPAWRSAPAPPPITSRSNPRR